MNTLSLRQSLTLRLSVLMLLFSALSSVAVYQLSLGFSDEAYDEWLLDSARSLAPLIEQENGHLVADIPQHTLQAMVFDSHDRILFRIDSHNEGLLAGHTQLKLPTLSQGSIRYSDLSVEGQRMRAVQVVLRELQANNPVTITMAETLNKRKRLASRVLGTVMTLSGLLCLVTLLFARDAIGRGLRPILDLTVAIRLRKKGDLTLLPEIGLASELTTFTQAINELIGQLDQAVHLQRRFVADAAHQLRTPLAALKVELEHASRETDPLRHQQALHALREGLDRLSRLTTQLLALARAEPGALTHTHLSDIDLHQLAYDTTHRHLQTAIRAGHDLGFEGLAHPHVQGTPLLIEEAINNLLDNAMRYAGPHATITVRVHHTDGTAMLEVQDNGPGVPESERLRLTERFHRIHGSHSEGSGLGLSIVQEIANRHGCQLDLQHAQPHGLLARLSWPPTPPLVLPSSDTPP